MTIHTTSKREWLARFPRSSAPEVPRLERFPSHEWAEGRIAVVSMIVQVRATWPGIGEMDDETRRGPIRYSTGRWYIDDTGISRKDGKYDISLSTILREDWMAHLLEKKWFYDPTDFFDALQEARKLLGADNLDDLMWREIRTMRARSRTPFFPSAAEKSWKMYRVDRMEDDELDAFCGFLADNQIVTMD